MKRLVLSIFLIGLVFAFASSSLSLTKPTESSGSCNISSENILLAASANCAPGIFSQMDVMREFAVVTKMGSTGVKDAVLTKAVNV